MALAKENGIEMTAEEAAEKYAQLHNEGELSDDKLDGASGGGCYAKDGRLVVSEVYECDYHEPCTVYSKGSWKCNSCKYFSEERGMCYCNHPANRT